MASITSVYQTPNFKKVVKKLHQNQKKDLDEVVQNLIENPMLGEQKRCALHFFPVCKFKMVKLLTLLGYSHEDGTVTLELVALGAHENFHRHVKNST